MGQCDIFLFWSKDHTTSKQAFFWMRHKGEDKFGAQLDLPHFENQKKKRRERSPFSLSAEAVNLDLSLICCHALS